MAIRRWWLLAVCALLSPGAPGGAEAGEPGPLAHRWLFVMRSLRDEETLERTLALLPRAAAAGYTAVVLSDWHLYRLDHAGFEHAARIRRLQEEARRQGLELIPVVMPLGYSDSIIAYDPNLAEGLPVREALFITRGEEASHVPDPPVSLPGGDFEEVQDHRFAGWDWQDNAGKSIFSDREVVRRGQVSVRMEGIREASPEHGHCRFMRTVQVSPFRQYHLSAWIRTEEFENPESLRVAVLTEQGRPISYAELEVAPTQDWRQYDVVFNSLDNDALRVYIGTWAGEGGRLWWDDVRLQEVGLLNVLRREGCPVLVRGEDGTDYEEGRDFEPIEDPNLAPGAAYHEPPVIRLTPDSRIREGQRLRVSYYHPIIIHRWQVMCCLSHPRVYEILQDQVRRVDELLRPDTFFMQHDEIRVANWCELCRARGLTPGEMLADNVRRCVQTIRELRPDADIWVWSDMFDPMHNAVDDYYLVNGTWERSWEGLGPEVGIVNWAGHLSGRNAGFFAERGHRQILAGYYDADEDGARIVEWLANVEGVPGVVGAMYTTWQDKYEALEAWARAAWGER